MKPKQEQRKGSRQELLDGLTKEQKDGAKEWLSENHRYVVKCVLNTLGKPWYAIYKKAYRDEAIAEGYECVYLNHYRYKEGPRSLRSWLYRIVQWYVRNYMNRIVIPYERSVVFDKVENPLLGRIARTEDFSPSYEEAEERDGISLWGHELEEVTTTRGNIF